MKRITAIPFKLRVVRTGILFLTGVFGLTACGAQSEGGSRSTVTIAGNGTVESHIIESFEQSYYDKEELQQKILSEAATYNRSTGEAGISVDKVAEDKGQVEVKMTYAGAKDYAAFNKVTFFVGTPAEAESAGYDLNVVLSGVKDPGETMGKSDILQAEDMKLLITDSGETVVLDGKAVYASDNAAVSDNQKTVSILAGEEGIIYILYK